MNGIKIYEEWWSDNKQQYLFGIIYNGEKVVAYGYEKKW